MWEFPECLLNWKAERHSLQVRQNIPSFYPVVVVRFETLNHTSLQYLPYCPGSLTPLAEIELTQKRGLLKFIFKLCRKTLRDKQEVVLIRGRR